MGALRRGWPGSPMNDDEKALLEAIGANPKPLKVLTRRPLTIAFGRRAYLPGLAVGAITFGVTYKHGVPAGLVAAAVAGIAFTLGLIAHEGGHLLFSRWARGISSRMLVLSGAGAIAIVEGRYKDARGAALFAAGGPLASIAVAVALVTGGLILPPGLFATALIVPGVLTALLAGINLLPLAPMDGYLLFRSWLWADLGTRAEAERRALGWSRCLIVYGALFSLLALRESQLVGFLATFTCVTFAVQHHAMVKRDQAS